MDGEDLRAQHAAAPGTGGTAAGDLSAPAAGGASARARDADDLRAMAGAVARAALADDAVFAGPGNGLDAQELSGMLAGIDQLRSALGALEMRAMSALDEQVRVLDAEEGVPRGRQGRRTAGEIQMASRISPALASRRLRAGRRMVREMPRAFAALAHGDLPVEAAYAIGRGVGPVDPALRGTIDEVLAAHMPDLEGTPTGQWEREVSALAHALDPSGTPRRHRLAERDRSVTVRAGAHGMGTVTAHLTGMDCAAIRRKLSVEAEREKAAGDPRTHGQIMADLFSDTLLGRDETMDPIHLDIGVVISERSLLSPTHGEPAHLEGYGVVDASQVRERVASRHSRHGRGRATRPVHDREVIGGVRGESDAGSQDPGAVEKTDAELLPPGGPPVPTGTSLPDPSVRASAPPRTERERQERRLEEETDDQLRRLYTHPTTGELVAMDSRSRAFPPGLARYMRLRDVTCAGPYCGAPIRHSDHIRPFAEGGGTSAANGQSLCAHCNLTKEALGRVEHAPTPDGSHRVTWATRLGRSVTVTPGSQTGLPSSTEPSYGEEAIGGERNAAPPRAEPGSGLSTETGAGVRVTGRAHLRLLIEEPDPGPDPVDPLDGCSEEELERMHRAALESFGPDDAPDDFEILDELDRLDAAGRPDQDLGSLSSRRDRRIG